MSAKEYLAGRKRAAAKPRPGTRTALYLWVSTADQKPDLQYDGLRGYAVRAGLDVVPDAFMSLGGDGILSPALDLIELVELGRGKGIRRRKMPLGNGERHYQRA